MILTHFILKELGETINQILVMFAILTQLYFIFRERRVESNLDVEIC